MCIYVAVENVVRNFSVFRLKIIEQIFFAYASLQPSVIENMTEFKRSLPLFPLVKPHINFMAAKLWRTPVDEEMQMISTDMVSGDFMMNKIIKDH